MALQNYYEHEWKPVGDMEISESSGCFDCNICLDSAQDPIVTLCGHLYCWPCIYKWLHVQSASLASDEHPQCPVCKADICHTAMVPLYSRGHHPATTDDTDPKPSPQPHLGMWVPPRPSACAAGRTLTGPTMPSGQQLAYRNPYQSQQSFIQQPPVPAEGVGGTGYFGGMVYSRGIGFGFGFGGSPAESVSYRTMGSSTPRLRRLEMQADKSLNRVWIFLFCCSLLCLIVF